MMAQIALPGTRAGRWNPFFMGDLLPPLRWKKPRTVWVNATHDTFAPALKDSAIDQIFAVMALCPQHKFQVLTKRPERMREYFAARRNGDPWAEAADAVADLIGLEEHPYVVEPDDIPLPNVWLGVSVWDQASANLYIPPLLETPAAVRFVSYEPAWGPVDWTEISAPGNVTINALTGEALEMDGGQPYQMSTGRLHWIISGGESGKAARPSHPDWFRQTRDQCAEAGVPFFFTGWGEWGVVATGHTNNPVSGALTRSQTIESSDKNNIGKISYKAHAQSDNAFERMERIGKSRAGRLLDGIEHNGRPG